MGLPYEPEELHQRARDKRRQRMLERKPREDGTVWPPETSEDDPYGEEDDEYHELD